MACNTELPKRRVQRPIRRIHFFEQMRVYLTFLLFALCAARVGLVVFTCNAGDVPGLEYGIRPPPCGQLVYTWITNAERNSRAWASAIAYQEWQRWFALADGVSLDNMRSTYVLVPLNISSLSVSAWTDVLRLCAADGRTCYLDWALERWQRAVATRNMDQIPLLLHELQNATRIVTAWVERLFVASIQVDSKK